MAKNEQKIKRVRLVSKMKNIPIVDKLPDNISRAILRHVRPDVSEWILYKKVYNQWVVEKHELNGEIIYALA